MKAGLISTCSQHLICRLEVQYNVKDYLEIGTGKL